MAGRIDVTPEEVEVFAQHLRQFSARLGDDFGRLRAQVGRLGESWRDEAHLRYVESFQDLAKAIDRFQKASGEHVPYLQRKAQAAKAARDVR